MAFKDRIDYHSSKTLQFIILVLSFAAFILTIHSFYIKPIALQADFFLMTFMAATLVLLLLEWWMYTPFFLLSTFALITSWRLASLAEYTIVSYFYILIFVFVVLQFFITMRNDLGDQKNRVSGIHNSTYEWQLLFVRMYLGYDLIPHFCEKLFAGGAVRASDVADFIHLGVPHPLFFVLLGGLIEFSCALSLSCGFITRLGALGLTVYLLVATMLGHHFTLGFIWANPGGGWEYPILWTALVFSFAWAGANTFSIDEVLREKFKLPAWFLWLMGIGKHKDGLNSSSK